MTTKAPTPLPRHRGRVITAPKPPPPPPPKEQPRHVVNINLNRKLMTHAIVGQLRDTAQSKGMVAGSAIEELLSEYDRLRYLLEGVITAYERNDEKKVRDTLDILRMIL